MIILYSKIKQFLRKEIYNYSKRKIKKYSVLLGLSEIKSSYNTLNRIYDYFHHYFWNLSPGWLKEHRKYFSQENRGFGEDAFHAMWYLLFKEIRPLNILEIGIYRGQTLSLFCLLSKELQIHSEIHGISPFSSAGDNVSNYETIDYYSDVIKNLKYFDLEIPFLHRGYSTDIEMKDFIASKKWDLIYIDGNHDYTVAKQDFEHCSKYLNEKGIIVLDDSSLETEYKKYIYSTAGHPGPSQVAKEINREEFEEFLCVGHNRLFRKIN